MISREVVDEIIARNDIESLIGSYVSLKRAGINLKGLCPFHSEKTPSFTVYPQDNSFYCFGCGIGGNAVTFIRQIEHLDYPDAIKFLAKRAGITLLDDNQYSNEPKVNKERFLKMNVDAAKFFHESLFSNSPKAKEALNYFTEKRRLSLATIKHFGLGYAPDSFDSLMKHLKGKGYSEEELFLGYLISKNDKGNVYDSFRDRVMFPIIDVAGNVIAFGGRIMDSAASKMKYKNSSDTPVFKKSRNLFALNFARASSAESLILCEGYMDVIALHSAGFTNAVATLGTAITPEQARLMSRYTKKVLISYDSDEAGQKATQKAMKLLSDVGIDVSVLKIPGAKDPDEYIKLYGKEKFKDVLSASKSKFEYNIESILLKYDINLPQDKIDALTEIEKMISNVYFMAERDIYISDIAKKFNVDVKSVKADVERLVKKQSFENRKNELQKIKEKTTGFQDKVNLDFAKFPTVAKNEENVLGLILLFKDHRKTVFENNLLTEDSFLTNLNKRIFIFIKSCYDAGVEELNDLNESFTPEEIGRITKMKISRMQLDENGDSVLTEAIDSLHSSRAKKENEKISSLNELDKLINSIRENTK